MKKISNNEIILKCHDEKAMTYDIIDINLMNQGNNFFDSLKHSYCDYETYIDLDISNLSDKINNNWKSVKKVIHKVLQEGDLFEIGFKQKGFCMIIEQVLERKK